MINSVRIVVVGIVVIYGGFIDSVTGDNVIDVAVEIVSVIVLIVLVLVVVFVFIVVVVIVSLWM